MLNRIIAIIVMTTGLIGTAYSQANFSASDTLKFLFKDTSFGTLHDQVTLYNHTSDSLLLRWVQRRDSRWPQGWTTTFQDPKQWHNPVDGVDSSEFYLPDSSNMVNNKLVIGVAHNNIVGAGVAYFTVFEPGSRADSIRILYDVTVNGHPTSIREVNNDMKVFPNPSRGVFEIEVPNMSEQDLQNITVVDMEGKEIKAIATYSGGPLLLQLEEQCSGSYLIRIDRKQEIFLKQIIVLND